MKRIMCRECRFTPGVPDHIKTIVEAHIQRYYLPDEQKPAFDYWMHWKTAGLYTHPDMDSRNYTY
jgi:molybdopterin-biosynthesis enzyme MoeA-like protein